LINLHKGQYMRSIRLICALFIVACVSAAGCKGRAAAKAAKEPVGEHKDPNAVPRLVGAAPNPSAIFHRPGS
jgi:hypothetical protein